MKKLSSQAYDDFREAARTLVGPDITIEPYANVQPMPDGSAFVEAIVKVPADVVAVLVARVQAGKVRKVNP